MFHSDKVPTKCCCKPGRSSNGQATRPLPTKAPVARFHVSPCLPLPVPASRAAVPARAPPAQRDAMAASMNFPFCSSVRVINDLSPRVTASSWT